MKKYIGIALVLAIVAVAGFTSFNYRAYAADEETATTTPAALIGGHIPFIAGSVDSIHNKGAWFISNKSSAPYVPFQIYYVAEHPELANVWKAIMEQVYKIKL